MSMPTRCLRRKRTGVYPPIITPLKNYGTALPYALIGEPSGCRGGVGSAGQVRRRAWFLPPSGADAPVLVALETMEQELGCCGEAPQCATVITPYVGMGAPIPKGTPLILKMTNAELAATFYVGCTEDEDGVLRYAAAPGCTAGPATSAWICLSNANVLRPNLEYGVANAATSFSSGSTLARALYAQPTLTPGVFQLAWQAPETAAGSPCSLLLVYPCECSPCLYQEGAAPPGAVVAGPTWPGM
jgi:hypothetical protein